MKKHRNITTFSTIICLLFVASSRVTEASEDDPSGLSETELNAPIKESKNMSRAELEKLRKGSKFYRDKLAKKPLKPISEWMKIIDSLKPGMLLEQVVTVLPRNSGGGSHLWVYSGIRRKDIRQTLIWAIDAKHAVAVQVDISGDLAWEREGKPMPRTKRYSNRIVGRPWILLHDNLLDEFGTLKSNHCRLR